MRKLFPSFAPRDGARKVKYRGKVPTRPSLSPALQPRISLVTILIGLSLFMLITQAQTKDFKEQCQNAAFLWQPPVSNEARIVKWQKPISYAIIFNAPGMKAAESIVEILDFISETTALKIEMNLDGPLDMAIVIVPKLSDSSSALRELMERFFQARMPSRRVSIDADLFNDTIKDVALKCVGMNMFLNSKIDSAVLLVEESESRSCFEMGMTELFGLANIREHLKSGKIISREMLASALKSLYNRRITAGLTGTSAQKIVGTICGSQSSDQ